MGRRRRRREVRVVRRNQRERGYFVSFEVEGNQLTSENIEGIIDSHDAEKFKIKERKESQLWNEDQKEDASFGLSTSNSLFQPRSAVGNSRGGNSDQKGGGSSDESGGGGDSDETWREGTRGGKRDCQLGEMDEHKEAGLFLQKGKRKRRTTNSSSTESNRTPFLLELQR